WAMTGGRVQPGTEARRTCQTMALSVLPAGISERATNQPFWAWLRPSNNCTGEPSDCIVTRCSWSPGANVTRLPEANGRGTMYWRVLRHDSTYDGNGGAPAGGGSATIRPSG